jgi:hypothetical protein
MPKRIEQELKPEDILFIPNSLAKAMARRKEVVHWGTASVTREAALVEAPRRPRGNSFDNVSSRTHWKCPRKLKPPSRSLVEERGDEHS